MPKTINDPALIKHVTNVHNDDIHGIYSISSNAFVSGSKDGAVKFFQYGTLLNESDWKEKTIFSPSAKEKRAKDNGHWITALDVFDNDPSILFGRRNSHFSCVDVHTKKNYSNVNMREIPNTLEHTNKHCKQRNEHRITSTKSLPIGDKFTALIGVPHKFYHYDCDSNTVLGEYTFNKADWPYGFCQISHSQVVVIHGCSLSNFSFDLNVNRSEWTLTDNIIQEARYPKNSQKPFISSVMPMKSNSEFPDKLALSFFGGKSSILDVETNQALHKSSEHIGRVWQAVPCSQNEYISCADDATVKIWDMRSGHASVNTYHDHPGRVSSIAVLNDSTFVAGTCPNIPATDPYKGQFYFYDMRRNSSTAPKANSIEHQNDTVQSHTKELSILKSTRKK